MMRKADLLQVMRAEHIPAAASGLWYISKKDVPADIYTPRHGKNVLLSKGIYTFLYNLTDDTLFNNPPGHVVMEDTPFELATHLGFVMNAYGKVLVTGLGLGCVVRGLLANEHVESVTVIENSKDVLKIVQPYMPADNRLDIIEADALKWTLETEQIFDCAWHDLWTNRSAGEPHLDIWHAQLFRNCKRLVKHQGAWAFDKSLKRHLINKGFHWIG